MMSDRYNQLDHITQDKYDPEVDDYVIWDQGKYGKFEGCVYFKGDLIDNQLRKKHGWNELSRYITIEIGTKPKPPCLYSRGADRNHKLIHTLLLCYDQEWKNLIFIKKRKSKNDDTIVLTREQRYGVNVDINEEESLYANYKSQEGRYLDIQ